MLALRVLTFLLAGSLFPIPGCFTVKVRSVEWPGISVRKELGWFLLPHATPVRFDSIDIYMHKSPPPFALQMPDGKILASDQLSQATLDQYFTPFEKLKRPLHPSWAHNSHIEFDDGVISVLFKKGKVSRVSVHPAAGRASRKMPAGATQISIGTKDGKRFYMFPISEDELIDIFGKPTRAKTYLFDT